MEHLPAFGIFSLLIIAISRRTLYDPRSHGFYRFLSWECIAWLLVNNFSFWFDNPLGIRQICSWIFLFAGLYLVIAGAILLKSVGKPTKMREDKNLYAFEKTVKLVDHGIFGYIRHPLYSSLIFLTWGILLKNPTLSLIIVAAFSTVFLYLTAVSDEKECVRFFGDKYLNYMKRTKRFIPFVI